MTLVTLVLDFFKNRSLVSLPDMIKYLTSPLCASRKLDKQTESPFSHWNPNNARFWFPNERGTRKSHYMTTWDLYSQWQSRQPHREGILSYVSLAQLREKAWRGWGGWKVWRRTLWKKGSHAKIRASEMCCPWDFDWTQATQKKNTILETQATNKFIGWKLIRIRSGLGECLNSNKIE